MSHTRFVRIAALAMASGGWLASPRPSAAQGSLVVTVTSPASGSTVGGTIPVNATVGPLGILIQGVQFQLDGANLGAQDTSAPYSVSWNTKTAGNGSHTVRAVARNLLGIPFFSDPVTVTVFNDVTPPSVNVTSPASGASVAGTVSVTANAADNVGVVGVQFRLDGASLGAEDTAPPFAAIWDTSAVANGAHTLTAQARDAAGNTTLSSSVTVTVSNGPPPDTTPPSVSVTAPAAGATVSGTITVAASAVDDVAVAGVQFRLDGAALGAEDLAAPYAVAWNTTGAANGAHVLTAVGRDTAGNITTSSSVTVSVSNGPAPDTTPPTAGLTSPAAGATVSGSVTVTANAADDVGVAGVQFLLDGAALGPEDTTAPYAATWATTSATNGSHTLAAIARDAAGNSATAAAVTVTVSNSGGFASGDVFVTIVDGTVQWRSASGTLRGTLTSAHDGQVSSAAFDEAGNLYVPHWWGRAPGAPGNTVVRFDGGGAFLGAFGSGYNSAPSSVTFDPAGNVYVGQADDSGDILKFDPAGTLLAALNVATVNRGTDHIDLAPDGCTMFYTSRSQDVLRYDVCTNAQLTKLNLQPLPGDAAYHVRALPDGGVLVADSQLIVRVDAAGNQVQSYVAPGETNFWGGVDIVGDGTFWASNAFNGNIYRFDLQSGAVVSVFNTGTGNFTAAGVAVKP